MGQLRERMMHDLELGGYRAKTRLIYVNAIRDFAKHFGRSPSELVLRPRSRNAFGFRHGARGRCRSS